VASFEQVNGSGPGVLTSVTPGVGNGLDFELRGGWMLA